MSKEQYAVDESADFNGSSKEIGHRDSYVDPSGKETRAGALAEATGIYGNAADAEQYGYVTRG